MTENAAEKIKASKKCSGLCPDTINRVLSECFSRYSKPKDAEKAARERLHGITGAFMTREELTRAKKLLSEGNIDSALASHASTRERFPLNEFYDRIFEVTNIPTSVLDLACGMNPIYIASRGIRVTGVDIDGDLMNLINAWAISSNAPAEARTADLLCENSVPEGDFDVVFLMKLLPVLETQRAGAARKLLDALQIPTVVATFPTRTLGGRNVGMEKHYSDWFEGVLPENAKVISRYVKNNELVYILMKNIGTEAR